MYWNQLKGLVIDAVSVHPNGESVTFAIQGRDVVFSAEGDCCSHSFIDVESVDGADVFGCEVLETSPEDDYCDCNCCGPVTAEEDKLSKYAGEWGAEDRKQYFYRLRTAKGWFSLTMYNDSNGWYGGSLENYDNRKSFAGEVMNGP